MSAKQNWFDKWVLRNGSYKVVALFVALVLWVAILGRKDFVTTHEMELTWKLPVNGMIRNRVSEIVRVKIGGPRLAIKRFKDSNQKLTIDLRHAGFGQANLRIQENDFILPSKVRLISIAPSFLSVDIRRSLKTNGAPKGTEKKNDEVTR